MESKQKYISVIAICLSVIIAGAIVAYNPFQAEKEDESLFKFPSGIPPSLGTMSAVTAGGELENAILVSGSGSDSTKATQATVVLGAWTEDPVASEAVEDNAQLMNAIIGAIEALGIGEDKIKTVQYSVSPNYNWETRSVTGYRVTNVIQVEVDDIDMVGTVIDEAASAGSNSIQGINFGISDDEAKILRNNAYVLALQDAQAKAELIAETLSLEVTGVLYVTESSYTPYTPMRTYAEADMAAGAPTPIVEGTLSVSVNVQVAFTFQQIA
jgi:hypothetical protein